MNKEAEYIHNRTLFSNKEQGYPAPYDNMEDPEGIIMLSEISQRKAKIVCSLSYTESKTKKTKQLIGKGIRFMVTRGGGVGRNWRKVKVKSYNLPVTR